MTERLLASAQVALLTLLGACSVREVATGQTVPSAPAPACTDSLILTRPAADESVRAELTHLRVHYRDVDGEATARVNVRLAAGRSIEPLAVARHAVHHAPVNGMERWYTLTFSDPQSAMASVRPLLCDPAVERAQLDIKRRYVRRSTR